jgi:uncharacterized membrane protein YkvA (DUF1232 family)
MKYSQLFELLEEGDVSAEEAAAHMGVAGMTLRRWKEKSVDEELPRLYQKAAADLVRSLVAEGRLMMESPAVSALSAEKALWSLDQGSNTTGITQEMLQEAARNPRNLIEGLSHVGANGSKQAEVDKNRKKILSFKKIGQDWSARISSLMKVLESHELNTFDKLVAYGALFYLICPFDMIPDYIPVFGFMDDFIVLGFAMTYYTKRFPRLIGRKL